MASTNVIGDSQEAAVQPIVSAFPLGAVTEAQIADKTDPVNIALYSGKALNSVYIYLPTAGGADIIIASGKEPTDTWFKVSDAGAAPITPA